MIDGQKKVLCVVVCRSKSNPQLLLICTLDNDDAGNVYRLIFYGLKDIIDFEVMDAAYNPYIHQIKFGVDTVQGGFCSTLLLAVIVVVVIVSLHHIYLSIYLLYSYYQLRGR
jgi:hypothetical protein